ncbi:hypothetical protein KCU65_g2870, partial [Aureobasidium melanogenum]
MAPSLAKSTRHADFVNKQLLKAKELYDAVTLDEPWGRCEMMGDWEYAEACRQEVEYNYECCSKHPDRYDPVVLAELRASRDALAEAWANKPVSDMTDEEVITG